MAICNLNAAHAQQGPACMQTAAQAHLWMTPAASPDCSVGWSGRALTRLMHSSSGTCSCSPMALAPMLPARPTQVERCCSLKLHRSMTTSLPAASASTAASSQARLLPSVSCASRVQHMQNITSGAQDNTKWRIMQMKTDGVHGRQSLTERCVQTLCQGGNRATSERTLLAYLVDDHPANSLQALRQRGLAGAREACQDDHALLGFSLILPPWLLRSPLHAPCCLGIYMCRCYCNVRCVFFISGNCCRLGDCCLHMENAGQHSLESPASD